jgi:primary-amine oxidase
VAILRRDRGVGDRWRFAGIELAEPDKATLLAWRPGEQVIRQARITCWNTEDGRTYTATVSLTGDEVAGFEHRPGVQANATVGEWLVAAAMSRRCR